jgi:hypothetical protein
VIYPPALAIRAGGRTHPRATRTRSYVPRSHCQWQRLRRSLRRFRVAPSRARRPVGPTDRDPPVTVSLRVRVSHTVTVPSDRFSPSESGWTRSVECIAATAAPAGLSAIRVPPLTPLRHTVTGLRPGRPSHCLPICGCFAASASGTSGTRIVQAPFKLVLAASSSPPPGPRHQSLSRPILSGPLPGVHPPLQLSDPAPSLFSALPAYQIDHLVPAVANPGRPTRNTTDHGRCSSESVSADLVLVDPSLFAPRSGPPPAHPHRATRAGPPSVGPPVHSTPERALMSNFTVSTPAGIMMVRRLT